MQLRADQLSLHLRQCAEGAGRLRPSDLKLLRHAAAHFAAFYHRSGMRR